MTEHTPAAVPTDGEPNAPAALNAAAAATPETHPETDNDLLRHTRGNRSTIADLPPDVRADICQCIRTGTPDSAIADDLHERGYAISRFREASADSLAQWSTMRAAAAIWCEGGAQAALPEMLRVAAFAIVSRMAPADPDCAEATRSVARIARAIRDLAAAEAVTAKAAADRAAAQAADDAPPVPAPGSADDPRLPSLPPLPPRRSPEELAAIRLEKLAELKDDYYKFAQPWWTEEDWREYARRSREAERIEHERDLEWERAWEAREAERKAERDSEPTPAPADGNPAQPAEQPPERPPIRAASVMILPKRAIEERRRRLREQCGYY